MLEKATFSTTGWAQVQAARQAAAPALGANAARREAALCPLSAASWMTPPACRAGRCQSCRLFEVTQRRCIPVLSSV